MKIYKISNNSDFNALCAKIAPHKMGEKIMKDKAALHYFYIKDARIPALNILKQDALSVGAELISPKNTILGGEGRQNAVLIANEKQIKALAKKEKLQDFGLKELGEFLHFSFKKPENSLIMGVVNFTDDSFFSASRTSKNDLVKRAKELIQKGANLLDFGVVSTRPNSAYIGAKAEFSKVKEVVDILYENKLYESCELSLDSFDFSSAKYALDHGFKIINDISANDELAKLCASFGSKYIFMHGGIIGSSEAVNGDIMEIVDEFFEQKIQSFKKLGLKEEQMILDVGVGFGKSNEQSLRLIKNLENFLRFDCDLLVGASRKSIVNTYFTSSADERLAGTLLLHQKALENGAKYIRAHDVYEHSQMLALHNAYKCL